MHNRTMNRTISCFIFAVISLALAIQTASAVRDVGHINLLAVYQEGDEFKGSPADVQLEIKPGEGRVFIETVPLSKVDTQISTRFAKEIACKESEVDCSEYDFFYTIRSAAGIVGGPSAGGAIAALTFAMLNDLDVDPTAAMTGTINSGGMIGPIGSLKEKVDAAKDANMKKVLVPAVQAYEKEENISIIEYGREKGVQIIPVVTLREAAEKLTGKKFTYPAKDINVPDEYLELMKEVAGRLCNRSDSLGKQVNVFNLTRMQGVNFQQVTSQRAFENLTKRGKEAFIKGNYYSAASYCFGANVEASTLLLDLQNLTDAEYQESTLALKGTLEDIDKDTESEKKRTITDLQTYMIVKERILEAQQTLSIENNDTKSLAYITERLNSAQAWSEFFGSQGQEYNLDTRSLAQSCDRMLAQVDERFQYLSLFFPGLLNDLKANLLTAHTYGQKGEYALCIYLAGKTNAEANLLVTLLGVREELIDELLKQKLDIAKQSITDQIDDGIFPIIAYSYYEYANSLKDDNKYSALLYSEYALELSDIDIYFQKEEKQNNRDIRKGIIEYLPTIMLVWGIFLGFLLAKLITRKDSHSRPGRKQERREGKTRLRLR